MNAKRTRNYYDMFFLMFNSQKSYQKYIENTHLGLLTETHEYYQAWYFSGFYRNSGFFELSKVILVEIPEPV